MDMKENAEERLEEKKEDVVGGGNIGRWDWYSVRSPLFGWGEVVYEASSDVLQRAFVLEDKHLWYRLHLHNGQEINTGITSAELLL